MAEPLTEERLEEKCPSCGAEVHPDEVRRGKIYGGWRYACGARYLIDAEHIPRSPGGPGSDRRAGLHESRKCRHRQLEQAKVQIDAQAAENKQQAERITGLENCLTGGLTFHHCDDGRLFPWPAVCCSRSPNCDSRGEHKDFDPVKRLRELEAVVEKPWLTIIRAERQQQDRKWGQQDHDDLYWLAILAEEVGELAQAILQNKDGGVKELSHVAAVSVAWLECIERREAAAEKVN